MAIPCVEWWVEPPSLGIQVLCAELGLAARHLGDISLHEGSGAEAEAMAACEKMEKNEPWAENNVCFNEG